MTEQMPRDKISAIYQSGLKNAMDEFRRTRIPKNTVYRPISNLKAEVSIKRKEGSGKGRVINKNDNISLDKLARNHRQMSIRKLTSKFNTTQSNTYSWETAGVCETASQEAGTHPKGCQVNSIPHTVRRVSWAKDNKATDWERSLSMKKCQFGCHKAISDYGAGVTNTQ